jgi:hypothetical protein
MRTGVLALVVTAGCGGGGGGTDIEPTLRFADLSDLEIGRLVSAATGSDGFGAMAQVGQFDDPFEPDPCPVVVEDAAANRVTITGGCTTADGTTIEGMAEIDNPLGWGELDYDFGRPSLYTFWGFALVFGPGTRMAYDGTMHVTPGYRPLEIDLEVDSFGLAVRSDLFIRCDATTCNITNSGLELVGAGGALVSGRIVVSGQSAGGNLTLRGLDTVEVTIANNCTSWRIAGTDRAFDPCGSRGR